MLLFLSAYPTNWSQHSLWLFLIFILYKLRLGFYDRSPAWLFGTLFGKNPLARHWTSRLPLGSRVIYPLDHYCHYWKKTLGHIPSYYFKLLLGYFQIVVRDVAKKNDGVYIKIKDYISIINKNNLFLARDAGLHLSVAASVLFPDKF